MDIGDLQAMERQTTVLEVVRGLGAELNGGKQPTVSMSTHLEWDLGMASVERTELLVRLESALGTQLSSNAVFSAVTVADLVTVAGGGQNPGDTVSREVVELQLAEDEPPPYPTHVDTLIEALAYQAKHQPTRRTLIFLEEGECVAQWSYPDLQQAAGRIAGGLLAQGVKPGDRVGIMLPTGTDYVATFFGVLWLGAIPVPLYPPFRLDQLEDYVKRQSTILTLAGVELLVSFNRAKAVVPLLKLSSQTLKKVLTVQELDGPVPEATPGQFGLIQFTSGSTGVPKGVTLTQQALLHNLRAYGYGMELGKDDVTISWLPLYHDMGLIGTLLGSIYHGQPLVMMGPQDFLARPSRWLWMVHKYRGTVSPAPNFAYEICARKIPDSELEGLDLSSWRIALNGAEAVRPETLQRFTERFAPYGFSEEAHYPAYGLAEASLAVTFPPPGRGPVIDRINRAALERDGVVASCGPHDEPLCLVACGRPLPDMEVRIVDDQGNLLPDRRRGHLQFRGPSSLDSYYNNPEATRQVKDSEGWVKTGDLGYLSEGELYLTGRSKDLIVIGGRNLHPEDIEDIVASVPGVRRGCVAAFGVSDEQEGTEALVVVAETRHYQEGEEKEALWRAISTEIVRQLGLAPDQVHLVPPHTVPKTPSGKIRRSETRERLAQGRLRRPGGVVTQVVQLLGGKARRLAQQVKEVPPRLARSVWCHSWLLSCLGAPQLVSLVSPAAGQRLLKPAAQLYLRLTGVEVEVRNGLDLSGPCVVVANHSSSLDPVILTAVFPRSLRFLVAPWVAEHPVFKHLILRLGHLPVQRGSAETARELQTRAQELLQGTDCLAAFPEGGIEITPGLRPFALGTFQLAIAAGVPIVPVALQGARELQPWPRTEPYPGKVRVTIGPPLRAAGEEWEDLVDLAARSRAFIAEHCGDPLSNRRLRRVD
jgi:1-acyl-sn-glycerol-3-phosphate acyltransferase